jgi:tetratricopeptide (TPR) repeat protein
VLVLSLFPRAARLEDTIQLRDGTELKGRMASLRRGQLSYKDASGQEVFLRPSQVASVVLDDAPAGVRQGDEALRRKDFDRAIKCYDEALPEIAAGKSRDINRQFVQRKLALAWRAKGKLEAALNELKKIRAESKDAYLREESFELSLEVAGQKEDRHALEAIIDEMVSDTEPIHGRGELELAKMLLRDSSADEAQKVLGRLAEKVDMPYAAEAQLLNLRALRMLGRAEDLRSAARGLATSSALDPSLGQAAHAALAWALLEGAGADRKTLRAALSESLKALSYGPPSKNDSGQDHAIALLSAGRANAALAKAASKREIAEVLKARADSYYHDLIQTYGATEWGKAARKELAELGPSRETQTGK